MFLGFSGAIFSPNHILSLSELDIPMVHMNRGGPRSEMQKFLLFSMYVIDGL